MAPPGLSLHRFIVGHIFSVLRRRQQWDSQRMEQLGIGRARPERFLSAPPLRGQWLGTAPARFQVLGGSHPWQRTSRESRHGTDNNGDTYSSDRPVGFGRNSFRTPMQTQIDVSLARRVRITERLAAEPRVEIFNLINHNNFITLNNVYGEGPLPRATFLQPVAGVAATDPSIAGLRQALVLASSRMRKTNEQPGCAR